MDEKASSTSESVAYKFTAKEYDAETGLYYFGARYLDPVRGGWDSPDKYLAGGKYFPDANDHDTEHNYYWYLKQDASSKLPGIGGVFNSVNLNVYHYAGNNPVKFIDPDGREDIVFTKAANPNTGRLESEGLAYKNGTFSGAKFEAFKAWAAVKGFFGGSVGKGDVEFFLGKSDKSFSDFSTLPDSTTDFGTAKSGEVYDYSRHDFGGKKAYLLTDPKMGSGRVPQDPKFGKPEIGLGKNSAFPGRNPAYVEGSHLHKAFELRSGWGGSAGCIIQKGFEGPNGMGTYLENSSTGQSGHVMIFR